MAAKELHDTGEDTLTNLGAVLILGIPAQSQREFMKQSGDYPHSLISLSIFHTDHVICSILQTF